MIEREGGVDIEKKHEANFERWFHKLYTIVSVVQTMNQNNYMILHVALLVTLDHIEVAS